LNKNKSLNIMIHFKLISLLTWLPNHLNKVGQLNRAIQTVITLLEKDNETEYADLDYSTDMGNFGLQNCLLIIKWHIIF